MADVPNVVVQQPTAGTAYVVVSTGAPPAQPQEWRDWESGLYSCRNDMESCCFTLLFGQFYLCCLYKRYKESLCTPFCVPFSAFALRVMHRNRHRISGNVMDDCCKASVCGPCVVCQVKRDMDFVEATKGSLQ